METATVGKVVVSAKIENLFDIEKVFDGQLTADQVRCVEVNDALVDTGATGLSLPRRLIAQLGLRQLGTRSARTASGMATFGIYSPVRLTVQARDCAVEVAEISDDCPPVIGVVPLEILDLVVDPKNQRLIGNPEHGGKQMLDMFPMCQN